MKYAEWVLKAEQLRQQGMSYYTIGQIVNKNRQVVSRHLKAKEQGIAIENHNERNTNMNKDAFEKIDTEEKAYWLGFMYADGYVGKKNHVQLALKESDIEHIKKFKEFLQIKNKIQRKVKNNKYVSYAIAVNNEKLHKDLEDKGCVQNKSFLITFPYNHIPEELYRHFIRGYVDGDGCLSYTSGIKKYPTLEILGTESFLNSIINLYDFLYKNKLYTFNHCDIKRISYAGKQAIEVLDYLYKDCNIYLDRKYAKYLEYKSLPSYSEKGKIMNEELSGNSAKS